MMRMEPGAGAGCVFDHRGRVPASIHTPTTFASPLEEAVYANDVITFINLVKVNNTQPGSVFSLKLRYLVGFSLVEIAISTNEKPTIGYIVTCTRIRLLCLYVVLQRVS